MSDRDAGSPNLGAVPQAWTGKFLSVTLCRNVSHSCCTRSTSSPVERSDGNIAWAGRKMTEYELVVTIGNRSPSAPA